MKTSVLAIALLLSGAAVAQTTITEPELDVDADVGVQPDGDLDVDADVHVDHESKPVLTAADTESHSVAIPAGARIVQPSNANPELDERGIRVLSDPAIVPLGWNGIAGTAMGGPLVDPVTGEAVEAADETYPACTVAITDNCMQTYE